MEVEIQDLLLVYSHHQQRETAIHHQPTVRDEGSSWIGDVVLMRAEWCWRCCCECLMSRFSSGLYHFSYTPWDGSDGIPQPYTGSSRLFWCCLLGKVARTMSAECSSYTTVEKVLVGAFNCPRADSDLGAIYCCGFKDFKYCCDDPNSFFPYEHSYMWWLR